MEIWPALRVGAAAGEERERGGTTTLVEISIALDERAIFGLLLLLFRLQLLLLRDEGNAAVDFFAVVAAERREKRIVVSQKVQKAEAKSERRKKNPKVTEGRPLVDALASLPLALAHKKTKAKAKKREEKSRALPSLLPSFSTSFPRGKQQREIEIESSLDDDDGRFGCCCCASASCCCCCSRSRRCSSIDVDGTRFALFPLFPLQRPFGRGPRPRQRRGSGHGRAQGAGRGQVAGRAVLVGEF